MIIEGLVSVVVGIIGGIIGLLPDLTPPSWLTNQTGAVGTVMGWFTGLGAWVPLGLVMSVAGSVLACMVIGLVIKLVRIVASFLTAGGGSAA